MTDYEFDLGGIRIKINDVRLQSNYEPRDDSDDPRRYMIPMKIRRSVDETDGHIESIPLYLKPSEYRKVLERLRDQT